jgi:type 2A phosphatase activator TIP41
LPINLVSLLFNNTLHHQLLIEKTAAAGSIMSIPKNLDKTELEGICAEQVEDLHGLFVQWFRGTRALEELQEELRLRLSDSFSHVAPNGQFLSGRQILLGHLEDKYGCYHDRVFEIDIYNVQLIWSDGDKFLVTYEEWQSWQQEMDDSASGDMDANQTQQFGRLSTCLLYRPDKTKPFSWIHVHETWLEDEVPAADAQRASETRAKGEEARLANANADEDTVMTGPVQQEVANPVSGQNKSTVKVLVLTSLESTTKEQVSYQEQIAAVLRKENIPFEEVNADAPGHPARNELLALSYRQRDYPRIFVSVGNTNSYWGGWELFDMSHQDGTLAKDLGIETVSPRQTNGDTHEEDGDPEEDAFMQASQGILVFEEENEEADYAKTAPELEAPSELPVASNDQTSIPNDISKKRHVSTRLEQYAKPIMWEGALVGVTIAGFYIGTSQGPIANEAWYKENGESMEEMAQSPSTPKPLRRICLPEMVFNVAHVALEGNGVWLSWDATAALNSWAQCHSMIPHMSRLPYQGVNVIKSSDAKKWESRRKHITTNEHSSSVFHYDWTFSTPYCGTVEGGEWVELDESGMRMELLTDQSIPILFFDDIVIYEDDLHDNGQAQYSVKLRVMPTCAYVLARLFVRVDNVVLRCRETRLLIDFFGMKPQIYRDVSWRECSWENLAEHGLPTEVRPWHHNGRDTAEWQQLVRSLPEIDPPKDIIYKHAVLEYPSKTGDTQPEA